MRDRYLGIPTPLRSDVPPQLPVFSPTDAGEEANGGNYTHISPEIRRAGMLYGQILGELTTRRYNTEDGQITESLLAKVIGRGVQVLANFRRGRTQNPDFPTIFYLLGKYVDPQDPRLVEMQEIFRGTWREEEKWLWRLQEENMPTSDAVRLIRLSQGDSMKTFAQKTSVSLMALYDTENGKSVPRIDTFAQILDNSEVGKRYKKVKQALLLKTFSVDPKSIKDVDVSPFGEMLQYFRVQEGMSPSKLSAMTGRISPDWIRDVEAGIVQTKDGTRVRILLNKLGLSPELVNFFVGKIEGDNIQLSDNLQRDLSANYLFVISDEEIATPFSKQDEAQSEDLKKENSVGAALRRLRINKRLIQEVYGMQGDVSDIELGNKVPEDYTVARWMMKVGVSVLDRTAIVLFDLAEKESAKHNRYVRRRT